MNSENRIRFSWITPYSLISKLMTILDKVPKKKVNNMMNAIWDQRGNPQNPVDWSDPDTWIVENLYGNGLELARRIWVESEHEVNPRYTNTPLAFIIGYELLITNEDGVFQLSDKGRAFLNNDAAIIRDIDSSEGLLQLLAILATKTRAKRSHLLSEWSAFLKEHSNYNAESTIKEALYSRLINLVERGYVLREGQYYVITSEGLDYAVIEAEADPKRKVLRAINAFNEGQKKSLKEHLSKIEPSRFEQLIRDLLMEMGYDNVRVTGASGDKGVDVVATAQFGITTVEEVVQVKRHQGAIGRQILDQLRGALPYHKAIRGTLITLGNFTSGCKEAALFPGAAPITLIDGEHLLDLLIENEVGIKELKATLYELDDNYFSELKEQTDMQEIPNSNLLQERTA
jgi:restriction system protein